MLRKISVRSQICPHAKPLSVRTFFQATTSKGKQEASQQDARTTSLTSESKGPKDIKPPKKTLAQLDEELRAAMDGRAGDGGLAGAELEGGKAVSMKRGVRDNMFRYI